MDFPSSIARAFRSNARAREQQLVVQRTREAMAAVRCSPRSYANRVLLAAQRAHDEPCTRDRAARAFDVPLEAVIAEWGRIYPDVRRLQVG